MRGRLTESPGFICRLAWPAVRDFVILGHELGGGQVLIHPGLVAFDPFQLDARLSVRTLCNLFDNLVQCTLNPLTSLE